MNQPGQPMNLPVLPDRHDPHTTQADHSGGNIVQVGHTQPGGYGEPWAPQQQVVQQAGYGQQYGTQPEYGQQYGYPQPGMTQPAPPMYQQYPAMPQQPQPDPAAWGAGTMEPNYMDAWPGGHAPMGSSSEFLAGIDPTVNNPDIIKIPVRLAPGEQPTFTEQDIILYDGDIVFIESRETEIFYTGGLLGGGQFTLPRDYDLDVLGAISVAQSQGTQQVGGGRATGGPSALNQDVTISASQVVVLRTLPNGAQVPIKVNLYDAVRKPQERLIIQPGDMIILQYTPAEAVGAFFERHLLEGALFGLATGFLQPGGNN